jgi:hypothetical protein
MRRLIPFDDGSVVSVVECRLVQRAFKEPWETVETFGHLWRPLDTFGDTVEIFGDPGEG